MKINALPLTTLAFLGYIVFGCQENETTQTSDTPSSITTEPETDDATAPTTISNMGDSTTTGDSTEAPTEDSDSTSSGSSTSKGPPSTETEAEGTTEVQSTEATTGEGPVQPEGDGSLYSNCTLTGPTGCRTPVAVGPCNSCLCTQECESEEECPTPEWATGFAPMCIQGVCTLACDENDQCPEGMECTWEKACMTSLSPGGCPQNASPTSMECGYESVFMCVIHLK